MNLPPVTIQNDKGERFEIAAEELPAQFSRQIQSWDLSFGGEARSDNLAGLHIGVAGAKRYILDSLHEKLDFSAIASIQSSGRSIRRPVASTSSPKPTGAAAINILEHQIPSTTKVSPSWSKYYRAFAASDELNSN